MASNGTKQDRHVKLLKRQRGLLINQLPDTLVLLNTLKLGSYFNAYEKSEISKQKLPSDKAEKFLDIMEFKPREVYQEFMRALHLVRPDLAVRLEGVEREVSGGSDASPRASNEASPKRLGNGYGGDHMEPREEVGNGIVEEAGLFGLSAPGTGPHHHLSHLGYSDRELLANRLNGRPPQRQIFHDFCQAFGIENRLIQASSRSGNPTGYLMQQLCSQPSATFDKLETALGQIGHADLYHDLVFQMQNGGMDNENN